MGNLFVAVVEELQTALTIFVILKSFNTTKIKEVMWFKRNGHFAKNELTESEVSHECQKSQTTIHSRIQG